MMPGTTSNTLPTLRMQACGRAAAAALLLLLAILLLTLAHIATGPRPVAPHVLHELIFSYDARSFDQQVLLRLRLPRLLAALQAGACLGMAGLLLQTLLRNPLGEPHILGLNAGASLAVVAATVTPLGLIATPALRPLLAATGAGISFSLVLLLASSGRQGLTAAKLIFCGIALSTLAGTLTSAILILNEETLQQMRFWLVGDTAGVSMTAVAAALPAAGIALIVAVAVAPRLDLLALGDNIAATLGVSVGATRVLALVSISLFCGASIAIVGPIGFVGLVVPPLVARLRTGRLLLALPLAALGGAALLIAADLAARLILSPKELPTGAMTGLVGAPVFLWLVRRVLK
ncbi:FecCD family ABC transporter permease [Agrobacterium sp. NPDC089420]|uniref:FecCD family ABC transporter permease n=1 Tax=Agrobacterium sp. NPDC089420 TaxID=3363918 RepID=UPI00384B2705